MKILILSPPRSGSTSLLNSICQLGRYKRIVEPYIKPKKLSTRTPYPYPLELSEKCAVKMLSFQVPKDYGKPNEYVNFIKSIHSYYDKKIILNRKNLKEHFESFINLKVRNVYGLNVHGSWYVDDIEKHKKNFDLEKFIPYRNIIDEISNELKIPIAYYEDLYGKDRLKSLEIIKSWDLDIDSKQLNELLHPKFKYRRLNKRTPI